ncbi:hypothetical protein DVH24_016934 [Malus domestica]|uniref:Uncharacterized protein n=1 Tax=Malus domestica TaxID=3750 RepID=A0A498IX65_MALDO|nr:hypothetical protein DVH24_016934 [Malus domestica]
MDIKTPTCVPEIPVLSALLCSAPSYPWNPLRQYSHSLSSLLFSHKTPTEAIYLTILLGYPIPNQEPLVPLACTATRCMSLLPATWMLAFLLVSDVVSRDRFGEASPEAKAANNLHSFFTYVAVSIVCAQLESYNTEAYEELMEFLSRNSLNDGDQFCANLMRESSRHKGLALRILEVRSAYCKNDFEWDNLQRLAFKMVDESNTRLMRDYVLEISHVEGEQGK